jgi:hypothetical protein
MCMGPPCWSSDTATGAGLWSGINNIYSWTPCPGQRRFGAALWHAYNPVLLTSACVVCPAGGTAERFEVLLSNTVCNCVEDPEAPPLARGGKGQW